MVTTATEEFKNGKTLFQKGLGAVAHRKWTPRCMGTRFLLNNEHRAAWERPRRPENERHDAWEAFRKTRKERHAAWERSAKTQNERHAAWEPHLCQHARDGSPQKDPKKTFQTICFKYFLTFLKAPLEHPRHACPKMWPPQVDAKELPRHSQKTLIFRTYFAIFVLRDPFDGRSRRALHFENKQKSIGFIMFPTPSLGARWGTKRNDKNCKTSATLHGNAPVKKRTSATLHGNAFWIFLVQTGPPK